MEGVESSLITDYTLRVSRRHIYIYQLADFNFIKNVAEKNIFLGDILPQQYLFHFFFLGKGQPNLIIYYLSTSF